MKVNNNGLNIIDFPSKKEKLYITTEEMDYIQSLKNSIRCSLSLEETLIYKNEFEILVEHIQERMRTFATKKIQ